jgi:hypothetical protein
MTYCEAWCCPVPVAGKDGRVGAKDDNSARRDEKPSSVDTDIEEFPSTTRHRTNGKRMRSRYGHLQHRRIHGVMCEYLIEFHSARKTGLLLVFRLMLFLEWQSLSFNISYATRERLCLTSTNVVMHRSCEVKLF